MQLRVARLCLDCEELHADKTCPRCASEHFEYLSTWLPTEERRRWRRAPQNASAADSPTGLVALVSGWLRLRRHADAVSVPATRRSDLVADLASLDERADRSPQDAPSNAKAPQSITGET